MRIFKLPFTFFRVKFKKNSFKILNLPLVALTNVINQLDIQSVSKLSKTSKKMRINIKNARRKVHKLIIDNHFEYHIDKFHQPLFYQRIILLETKSDVVSAYSYVANQENMNDYILTMYSVDFWIDWFQYVYINHKNLNDYYRKNTIANVLQNLVLIYLVNWTPPPIFLPLFSCLESLFGERRGVQFSSSINNWNKKQRDQSIFEYRSSKQLLKFLNCFDGIFTIDHLDLIIDKDVLFGDYQSILNHPIFRKCHYIEIGGRDSNISTEEMQFLLNKINVNYGMLVRCELLGSMNNEAMLKIPRLDIFTAEYITLKDLVNMDCEVIKLWRHLFTSQHINQFIHHWMAGAVPKLRKLRLNYFCEPSWVDEILLGVKHSKWDRRRRPQFFWFVYWPSNVDWSQLRL